MNDQLKRILNLVQKTGDTMIVTDQNGEDVYVIMGLDQYETLRNKEFATIIPQKTTESPAPEPIPPENEVVWSQMAEEFSEEVAREIQVAEQDIWGAMKPAGEEGETWDLTKMSEDEVVDLEEQYKKYAQATTTPVSDEMVVESKTEEIPQKLAENEDEFGEEQFYLEPIE